MVSAFQSSHCWSLDCGNDGVDSVSIPALIERWLWGDDSAASELYQRSVDAVRRVVSYHLNRRFFNRCNEDDAVQIVFCEVFRRLRAADSDFQDDLAFLRWVRTIARNRTIRLIKFHLAVRRTVGREMPLDGNEYSVGCARMRTSGASTAGSANDSDFRDWLTVLDDQSRQIIAMILAMFTQEEIAARLGCTTRTIRRRLVKLRDYIESDR